MQIDNYLTELLHGGMIRTEEEFIEYYNYVDDMLSDSLETFPTTLMRIHLDEGYCQISVRENPNCRYSDSAFGIFQMAGEGIPILFFNYDDEPVDSLEELVRNYMDRHKRKETNL